MNLKKWSAIPVLLLLFSSVLFSNTYYVSASRGNDENPGTEKKAFKTIQKAADVVVAGDTCIIREGIYRETITLKTSGTKDKPICFMADDDDKVVISGANEVDVNWVGYFDYDRTWSEEGEKTFQSQGVDNEGKNYTALYMDGKLITKVDSPKGLDGPAKWYLDYDDEDDYVRIILWPPDLENVSDGMDSGYNTPLNYTIEAKIRENAFIASNIDYIILNGISLFAVTNKLDNCNDWSIDTK